MARLRRFLHLERAREPGPPERGPAGAQSREVAPGNTGREAPRNTGRFDALEQPAPATRDVGDATGAAAERFGPAHDPGLQLAEREAGARPFQRCPACGRDHGLHEVSCTCGARLDTPEVQAWNDALWTSRAAEDARAAADAEASRARAAREAEEVAKLRYEMGIELARQVGDRERARLGMAGFGHDGRPLGFRLWEWLPERLRLKVIGGIAAGWFVLLLYGLARRRPGAILAAIFLAILALVPPGRVRGRFGGWD